MTNAEYAAFLNAMQAVRKVEDSWYNPQGSYEKEKARITLAGGQWVVEAGYERHPVIYVSWLGAQAYCAWLRTQTGHAWRLPSEAEWEYAAGGGANKRTKWAGTNEQKELGEYAWYDANSGGTTHPVGEKKPNSLGLYDMSGNVWEWCEDDWHGSYQGAPGDGSAWVDSPQGSYRVLRGGSWDDSLVTCRVANRGNNDPTYRNYYLGFRLARSF